MKYNNGWRCIVDDPPRDGELVLVTNNPTARNKSGVLSHIWISTVWILGGIYQWWDYCSERRIHGVVAYLPIPIPLDTEEERKAKLVLYAQAGLEGDNVDLLPKYTCPECNQPTCGSKAHNDGKGGTCYMVTTKRGGWRQLGDYDG